MFTTPTTGRSFGKLSAFDKYKGGSLATIHPGGCADPGVTGNDFEAIIDVEWASAAAPSADLQLITCADTTTAFGGLIAIQNLVNEPNVPPIISLSWANCEAQNGNASNIAYRTVYLQAVLEGVSIFVAAGDNGAAMCDYSAPASSGVAVNAFASTAYDVAVGGTDFGDTYSSTNADYWAPTTGAGFRSALGYVPEIPWNDTCASALISRYLGYATPWYERVLCRRRRVFSPAHRWQWGAQQLCDRS